MPYIKKLVMYGFKSFPRKTEIPLTQNINCILGPNGSGKSNITDALCFVLGRLSAKSMRAAKSQNLIFLGTKSVSPAKESSVELIFDNSDQTFSIPEKEISIKRILRKNGQSIYKINNQTKTRQEMLTLLAQAGIDPNGFNIILQGEIHNFVKMHNEERRKIIEEVSGISVYESRKQKSLNELEKTEEKLKEVLAILRERTAYLNNLENERQQALKYKKLEADIRTLKASIIKHHLEIREKHKGKILAEIDKKKNEIEKIKSARVSIQDSIKDLEEKITLINSTIQKSAGFEQEKINRDIANLRAELAGAMVKLENYENKILELSKQEHELTESIRNNELSIKELQKESPVMAGKQKDLESKKKELEYLEKERKKFYMIKSELKAIKERFEDKKNILLNYQNESNFLVKQVNDISNEMYDRGTSKEKIESLKKHLLKEKEFLENLNRREREIEKLLILDNSKIESHNRLIEKVSKIDICPICKSKITKDHVHSIHSDIKPKIESLMNEVHGLDKELNELVLKKESVKTGISKIEEELSKRESDLIKMGNMDEKKEKIKLLHENIEKIKKEIKEIENRKSYLEENFEENSNIEKKYETALIEVQEISSRSGENLDSEISFKQRELERSKISLKQIFREQEDYNEELSEIRNIIEEKENILEKKKKQEEELAKKFKKLIYERDSYHAKIRQLEQEISNQNNNLYHKEQELNEFNIDKAKISAEMENLESEFLEFKGIEIIKASPEVLSQRLEKAKEIILKIGSVNLRSLEVYDSIKKEYDSIKDKVEIISKEKEGILKIIHEIDIKKKKTFFNTLNALNEKFSRNFSQISTKGHVSLELENKKEPFEGGVGILVKTGHGKYFDVTSLSGGEQTMVALSLIFAIQELNPYCFYILDEIDAALDKRNSERLANLLKKYMQNGQYIIITHNDEIILSANNLYGVSMHEGISKIISMKV